MSTTLRSRMQAMTCRCLAHRGVRLVLGLVIGILNFAHPVLHALHLEGGAIDAALPYLNGLMAQMGTVE